MDLTIMEKEISDEKIEKIYEFTKKYSLRKVSAKTLEEKKNVLDDEFEKSLENFGLTLTDEEVNQVKKIIEGKKVKSISSRLIDNFYVFSENNKYLVPQQIENIINSDTVNRGRQRMAIEFYIQATGLIDIPILIDLIKKSGISILKEDITKFINESENAYKIVDNKVFITLLEDSLDKFKTYEEVEYKVYKLEEMFQLMHGAEIKDTIERYIEILEKYSSEERATKICLIIEYFVKMYGDEINIVNEVLKKEQLFLEPEDKKELDIITELLYYNGPSWFYKGNTPSETWNRKGIKKKYIHTYLIFNGALKIEFLINYLRENHRIYLDKKELKDIVKTLIDVDIQEDIILMKGMNYQEASSLILQKNMFSSYKKIDKIEEMIEESNKNFDKIDVLCEELKLNSKIKNEIISAICFEKFNEIIIEKILEINNVKFTQFEKSKFLTELKNISKSIRIWTFNGYNTKELSSTIKKEKIGRNEKCPCGSGKKYKHCCGR